MHIIWLHQLLERKESLYRSILSSIFSTVQEQRNGILYEFYRIMKDFAANFMEGITGAGELTLLAPSNEAFRRLGDHNLKELLNNQQKLTEILHLHVIRQRISSDEIIHNPLFQRVISPLAFQKECGTNE